MDRSVMTEHTDVVIVGAGGGGAVLGLALAQKGVRAIVLEQSSGPPTGLRGEILQPNGQQILDRLGVLRNLSSDTVRPVRQFHFCRIGGERLCTIDYDLLPPPYNRAMVTLPNTAHHIVLRALEAQAPGSLRYGAQFRGLVPPLANRRSIFVDAEQHGEHVRFTAELIVGADGAFSKVREALNIGTDMHVYREGYLIAMLDDHDGVQEGRYFVGHRTILGLFPVAGGKIYVFYMIPAGSMERINAAGIEALRDRWTSIEPRLEKSFHSLVDWKQTAYMPAVRVRTGAWVVDGGALIGDAAHAMNPHASQGRMQAMVDAMALADVISLYLERNDCRAEILASYERTRRPQVEMLQRLADEQVLFWNTGNPLLGRLRDRVFKTLDRNRRLRYQVLATTAGLRTTAPFGWADRLIAAGLWPDFHADRVPSDTVVHAG